MDVSIIIVNYNTRELLMHCLKTLYTQIIGVDFEVIMVDNHSQDGSVEAIAANFPSVKVLSLSENIGFGKANNHAANYAMGDYLFFLNSDTYLLNNALDFFLSFVRTYQGGTLGAVGSPLLDSNELYTHSSADFPRSFEAVFSIFLGIWTNRYWKHKHENEISRYGALKEPKPVDFVTGADLFISRTLFDNMGGFDPGFFMYYEDTDLQKRLVDMGYTNYIIPGPKIVHHMEGSDSKKKQSFKKRRIMAASMFHYFKKHEPAYRYSLFRLTFSLVRLPLLFDARAPWSERKEYIRFIFKA